MSSYALITPAHNEESFIEKTLCSVISQTVLPKRWVIVSDGSTDRTADIVRRYASQHGFMSLIELERESGRHFGNKVRAFNRGLSALSGVQYSFIGNLDADISLGPDYFQNVLEQFERNPALGIAGGMVSSRAGNRYVSQNVALDSVAGAVQMFRRECFEQIGGYLVLPLGGIDAAAEITARMKGWQVRTFPEFEVFEHRWTGTATSGPLASRIKEGRRMHALGYDMWFFSFRCLYRAMERPRFIGSIAAFAAFVRSRFKRDPIVLPTEVVRFLQAEQRQKLRRFFRPRQLSSPATDAALSRRQSNVPSVH